MAYKLYRYLEHVPRQTLSTADKKLTETATIQGQLWSCFRAQIRTQERAHGSINQSNHNKNHSWSQYLFSLIKDLEGYPTEWHEYWDTSVNGRHTFDIICKVFHNLLVLTLYKTSFFTILGPLKYYQYKCKSISFPRCECGKLEISTMFLYRVILPSVAVWICLGGTIIPSATPSRNIYTLRDGVAKCRRGNLFSGNEKSLCNIFYILTIQFRPTPCPVWALPRQGWNFSPPLLAFTVYSAQGSHYIF